MKQRVFSFSTRSIDDTELVVKIKSYCTKTGESFSTIVIKALKNYMEETNAITK